MDRGEPIKDHDELVIDQGTGHTYGMEPGIYQDEPIMDQGEPVMDHDRFIMIGPDRP